MVKDIGQAALDSRLITKPGMLSKAEYSIVQSHVEEGLAVLEATSRLAETSVAVVLEHHERYNGCGYPYRMAGDEISVAGRMAAIVDTYDAMTSARPYRAAMAPSHALRQLYDEGGTQYDPGLVAAFIKTVGIYPVGTLVLLESGHLAVVEQLHPDNMLTPIVRVIYHTGRRQYVTEPVEVDLARKIGNHYGLIVRAENYETWGISPCAGNLPDQLPDRRWHASPGCPSDIHPFETAFGHRGLWCDPAQHRFQRQPEMRESVF